MTMFREAEVSGHPGPVSIRRVLAFLSFLAAIGLFILGLLLPDHKWNVFIPGIACLILTPVLLFFTTWADIVEVTKAARGK